MLVVVTTDHITAWSIFYLKHHSLMVLWGGLPPLVELFVELNVKSIDVVENVIL